MAQKTKSKVKLISRRKRSGRKTKRIKLQVALLVLILAGSFGALVAQTASLYARPLVSSDQLAVLIHKDLAHDFRLLSPKIRNLVDDQIRFNITVVPDTTIQQEITSFSIAYWADNNKVARADLNQLSKDYTRWRHQLDNAIHRQAQAKMQAGVSVAAPQQTGALQVPIVLYHHPTPDMEQQLQYLVAHHYTTISPDQLAAALTSHAALPSKPILLTFDDGFADQWSVFTLLQKYSMRATYYIIDGGPDSRWCIGAGRRYGDPLQPPSGCGDGYLNWDQVRQLDQSGLVTIGSHTIDHSSLVTLSPDQQRYEIVEGKAQLEAQLGHAVHSFAYPYGSFNATSISLVRQAGFTTAVTTLPGTFQSASKIYELYRIRVVTNLP